MDTHQLQLRAYRDFKFHARLYEEDWDEYSDWFDSITPPPDKQPLEEVRYDYH